MSYKNTDLLTAGMPDYDVARQVWNAMIDRRPEAIAPCRAVEEVAAAVDLAKARGLPVSIKGGGHNIAGTAVADAALTIDLAPMRAVVIDPQQRTASVEGGTTWAEFDAAAQRHGLAAPGGVVSSTGVAGLTLGGGFGWLARKHGLAVDNLIAVQIVLASGETVIASAESHPDLFWAIRGGGGNFGVATRFTFRLHSVGPTVLFGPTFFSLHDAGEVLSCYARRAQDLPNDACVWANLTTAPPVPVLPEAIHGTKVLVLMQFHSDTGDGRDALAQLYGGARALGSGLMPRPFTEAQSFLNPAYEPGARNYWRTHNHAALSPELIKKMLDLAPDLPTPESEILITQLGGAVADIPADATAFPHRQVPFMSTPGVRWHESADDDRVIGWLKTASDRIAEHAEPGGYVNFIAETEGGAQQAYGTNLSRLISIKQRYDPENLFRSNQNIKPAA